MSTLKVGDKVHLRGDRRTAGRYDKSQLVDGKYVKVHGTDRPWTGIIKAIDGDMALCGGGWRGIEMYETV